MKIFEKIYIPFTKVYFDNENIANLEYSNKRKIDSYEYANIIVLLSNKFRLTDNAKNVSRLQKVSLKAKAPIAFSLLKPYADMLVRWVTENYTRDAVDFVKHYLTTDDIYCLA